MNCILQSLIAPKVAKHGPGYLHNQLDAERWNIQRAHLRALFTHFKKTPKPAAYIELGSCVLLKNQNLVSYEMGKANQRPYFSTYNSCSIYSISLVRCRKCSGSVLCTLLEIWVDQHGQPVNTFETQKRKIGSQKVVTVILRLSK